LPKAAVVILNWNGRKFLEKFLPLVIKFSIDDADIIVADNASTDSSIEFLERNFPSVRIIKNSENGGFAKGYNDALSQIDADYYILLNSDIEVTENWIPPVLEMMEKDEFIAAGQPKIRSFHNPELFEYAGAAGGFIDKFGYPFCRGRIFQSIEEDIGQYDNNTEIFWATGACMFVKSELFHQFGGLDNDFFAHMEEIDFCWRVKNEGYKIISCSESTVYHIGGGTLPKLSAFKTYLNIRNNIIMLYKNLPSGKLFSVLMVRFFLDMVASVKFLVDGGWKDFFAVFRAYLSFYRRLSKHRSKRAKINQQKVSQVYGGNIAALHYLKRIKKFSELDPERFT